jgi:hypothetical protein
VATRVIFLMAILHTELTGAHHERMSLLRCAAITAISNQSIRMLAQAAELKMLTSVALTSVLDELTPMFEKATGTKLSIDYNLIATQMVSTFCRTPLAKTQRNLAKTPWNRQLLSYTTCRCPNGGGLTLEKLLGGYAGEVHAEDKAGSMPTVDRSTSSNIPSTASPGDTPWAQYARVTLRKCLTLPRP